jgi:hypothetical protein
MKMPPYPKSERPKRKPNLEEENPESQAPGRISPALEAAQKRVLLARKRLLSAAIAFCDGVISIGQLKAVRELLREQETHIERLKSTPTPPFVEETPSSGLVADPEILSLGEISKTQEEKAPYAVPNDEIGKMIASLDQKMALLDQDFRQGRINTAQYQAIRKHYQEQREVALQIRKTHPESDRWKVVLEEGKTSFLLQLNEATVHFVAFYDLSTHKKLFAQGNPPADVGIDVALLRILKQKKSYQISERMLATHSKEGLTLLLIPGRYTAALVSFSQDPPGWQVRALREVHRNFEAANLTYLERGVREELVFPNLERFIKG